MLTVDGDGSTLDADLLDGNEATAFMTNATVTTKGDLLEQPVVQAQNDLRLVLIIKF